MKDAVENSDYILNDDDSFNIKRGGSYSVVKGKLMRNEPDDKSVDASPIDLEKVEEDEI